VATNIVVIWKDKVIGGKYLKKNTDWDNCNYGEWGRGRAILFHSCLGMHLNISWELRSVKEYSTILGSQ
jgi:hypothetical protein